VTSRWELRPLDPQLTARYENDGWWGDETLGSIMAESLAAAPDVAVHVHSHTHAWHGTFGAVDDEARRLVSVLQAEGIEPGSVVAFQMPNWREAVVAFAALTMGGYVLVPIVHIYGAKEVGFILREAGVDAYLSPAAFGHVDYASIIDTDPAGVRLHLVAGDGGDRPAPPGVRRIGWEAVDAAVPATELPEPDASDVVVLAYTSGTTSDPKGVIHSHRTLLADIDQMSSWITPGHPNLMGSPVTHATGMLGAVLSPVRLREPIHLLDRWDPGHALAVMADHGIGGGTGASVFLAGLLDHPDFTPAHAANMRCVGLGGAPVPVSLGRRAEAHGIKIIRAYGSTEHPSITGSQFDDPPDQRHGTDGPPMAGVEMRLLDDDGHEVGVGTPGEIVSRGPDLCLGYTDPALNDAFDADGWYHTGDIGVVDEHGALTITDRVKDIIIRGGENLSAAEIEGVLAGVEGIAEVAVVAAPDERLGEHACAFVRLQAGREPITVADLQPHLESAGLARQKWPEELRVVPDFPRTASGKIRKVDLRARLRAEATDDKEPT